MIVHSFNESLRLSHKQANAPWWEIAYRQAFPGFAAMTCVRNDGWAQRGGIDRVITLESGKTISVDEKVRDKDYGDVLLEHTSDEGRGGAGWIEKDLACDYIAYAIIPTRTCYLFPFLQLRRAWLDHGKYWRTQFRSIRAQNPTYVTVSTAVPTEILFGALEHAMRVTWATA